MTDPTQASAARLTAFLHANNAHILCDGDTDDCPLHTVERLLAQIGTLRQERARLEARITAQPEIVFTSLASATIEAQRLAALCEEWYEKFRQAEQDRDAARAALEMWMKRAWVQGFASTADGPSEASTEMEREVANMLDAALKVGR